MKILVIDYGVGNHQSVSNALQFLGYEVVLSGEATELEGATALILPGVGAFKEAMHNLRKRALIQPLREQVLERRKPILGICLGMQILAESSEEGGHHEGLGFIPGHVRRLNDSEAFPVPHVGWNNVHPLGDDPLYSRVNADASFFFDHSYYYACNERYISATCNYGSGVTASVRKDNIFGVQFHPEKSQNNGLKLFRGFLNYVASPAILEPDGPC